MTTCASRHARSIRGRRHGAASAIVLAVWLAGAATPTSASPEDAGREVTARGAGPTAAHVTGETAGTSAGRRPEASPLPSAVLASALATALVVVGAVAWMRRLQREQRKNASLRDALTTAEEQVRELQRTIAALRRTHDLLQDSQRAAGAGSFEMNPARSEVAWTRGLFQILRLDPARGVPPPDEFDAMLAPDDRPRLAAALEAARAGRDSDLVVAVTCGDGTRAAHQVFFHPVRDEGGRVTAVRGTALDVTAHRRHEEQLAAMRDQAIEATAAKSAFLARMSHELRTPLNGVIGMTTLLLDSPLSSEQRDQAETIRQCGALLLERVDEVLDFSRVEANRLELEAAPFEVRGLLEDTLQIVAERAQAKGLELMLDADASLPTAAVGDAGRLRQVLLNLLGNAIKFTETGHVVLAARATEADRLEFSVCDTGIGIASAAMPRLFQPFSQADPSTTRRFGGTGLGLAICRQLVGLMGGEITVESEPGAGSCFRFTAVLPETPPLDAPLPALPGGYRALCIDDHPRHRAILASMLERANVSVDAVGTLAEAGLRLAGPATFHLVVLDAEIEGAAAWLPTARPAMPPILALTADAGHLTPSPQWSAILPRPVREPLLAATVARLLGVTPPRAGAAAPANVGGPPAAPIPPDLPVLVVDDNPVNQRVATRSLQKLGCRVDTAANGRDAVEMALATTYALVLMDCQMPVMDGYEATRELRARQPASARTPVVAMTAAARTEDRDACLASGMDDYLSKPFTLPDLQRVIAQWAVVSVRR